MSFEKLEVFRLIKGAPYFGFLTTPSRAQKFRDSLLVNVKIKQSCYRPGVAQRVPGS